MILQRIISGGQKGVDRAALEVARELGIATGGWVPKGCRTEDGPDYSLLEFGCREHWSHAYPPRTEANVRAADATVVFFTYPLTGGTAATIKLAHRFNRFLKANPTAAELRLWLDTYPIRVLNVAGPRASKNPHIAAIVKQTIRQAIQLEAV